MSSDVAKPETINSRAKTCIKLFSESIQLASEDHDSRDACNALMDEFGRFKLWTYNIGVFADLHSSLDFRLRQFDDIKEPFLKQLSVIEIRLQQLPGCLRKSRAGSSIDDSDQEKEPLGFSSLKHESSAEFEDWDETKLLQSIHQAIDWLHRLSNLVRKASFANQNKRADNFRLEDDDGNDSSDYFLTYFSKLIKREFSELSDDLTRRIAKSMLLRRRRIMYRRAQQQRWKLQDTRYQSKSIDLAAATEDPAPSPLTPKLIQTNAPAVAVQTVQTKAVPSRLTITTLDADIHRRFAAPSGISRGSTVPLWKTSDLLVPPPPAKAGSEQNFICSYCCLILPSNVALERERWVEHVHSDLYPYVCVADRCDDDHEIYSSKKEWLAHIRTRHLMRWHCMAKSHGAPAIFEHRMDFIEHMKLDHPGKFRDDQLDYAAESSSHPKPTTFESCPFCAEDATHLEEHISQHLRDLALRSLPLPEDDDGPSKQNSFTTLSSSSSDRASRETMDNLWTESEETVVADHTVHEPAEHRFVLYDYLPYIKHQHTFPSREEQLSDEILGHLARVQQQHNLSPSETDSTSTTSLFNIIGVLHQFSILSSSSIYAPAIGSAERVLRLAGHARPFTADLINIFSELMMRVIPPSLQRLPFGSTFRSEEAITKLIATTTSGLSMQQHMSRGISHFEIRTSVEYLLGKGVARTLCQNFLESGLIESAEGRHLTKFIDKAVWRLTPKGKTLVKRYSASYSILVPESRHLYSDTPNLLFLQRDDATDKPLVDFDTVAIIFTRFTGLNFDDNDGNTQRSSIPPEYDFNFDQGYSGVLTAAHSDLRGETWGETFTGQAAVSWLMRNTTLMDVIEAMEMCSHFIKYELIQLVKPDYRDALGSEQPGIFQPSDFAVYRTSSRGKDFITSLIIQRERPLLSPSLSLLLKSETTEDQQTGDQQLQTILTNPALLFLFNEHLRQSQSEDFSDLHREICELVDAYLHTVGIIESPASDVITESPVSTMCRALDIFILFLAPDSPRKVVVDFDLQSNLQRTMLKDRTGQTMGDFLDEVVPLFRDIDVQVTRRMAVELLPKFLRNENRNPILYHMLRNPNSPRMLDPEQRAVQGTPYP